MEIFAIGQDGIRREAHCFGDGTFKCFPRSCNEVKEAKIFRDIREAAVFLVQHPDWGIRMNPGSGIIYEGITIVRR